MNVLMLCWELPPFFSGGLGIACEGIADNLSKLINLKVVVPFDSEPKNFKTLDISKSIDTDKVLKDNFISFSPYQSSLFLEEDVIDDNNLFLKNGLYSHILTKVNIYKTELLKLKQLHNCDIIYAHDWLTFIGAIALKKQTGKKLVVHIHSLEYDRSGADVTSKSWIYNIEKQVMELAEKVIVVSNYTAKVCQYHYDIDPDKISVVHNGINPIETKTIPFNTSKRKEVVFLGRLTKQKGVVEFIEICKHLIRKNNNVRITIAGEGDSFGEMTKKIESLGLENYIRFIGVLKRNQIANFFKFADVLCVPSVSEPFGLVALESAQAGVPLVVSKQSGVIEVLKGVIAVNYWEKVKFADAINELLSSDTLYETKKKQLLLEVDKLTWEVTAEKINDVFKHL